jgi:hypothetical protein
MAKRTPAGHVMWHEKEGWSPQYSTQFVYSWLAFPADGRASAGRIRPGRAPSIPRICQWTFRPLLASASRVSGASTPLHRTCRIVPPRQTGCAASARASCVEDCPRTAAAQLRARGRQDANALRGARTDARDRQMAAELRDVNGSGSAGGSLPLHKPCYRMMWLDRWSSLSVWTIFQTITGCLANRIGRSGMCLQALAPFETFLWCHRCAVCGLRHQSG